MPQVSIILPTHNGAHFIAKAIESVMAQSFTNWELIVINDGSSDNTKAVVEGYVQKDSRIIYSENEDNIGIQKTLNKGIVLAQGKYLARLDDDDRWVSTAKLEEQVAFMQLHPDYVLVGTDAIVVDTEGKQLSVNIMPKTDEQIRNNILSKNCFSHATILAKKDIVQKVGGYPEGSTMLHAEDYDLWLRMGKEGKFTNLPLQSTYLTAHPESLTAKNRVLQAKNILSIITRYKNNYPHFYKGYTISYIRYIGFSVISVVPIPKKVLYFIQRMYRSA